MTDGRSLSKITQGVTTEVMGETWTPAPFGGKAAGVPEGWRDRARKWHRFGDWLEAMVEHGVSPNIGSFLSGGTLRSYARGLTTGPATADELDTMRRVMDESMQDGAFGVSYALIYPPDTYVSTDEIVEICDGEAKVFRTLPSGDVWQFEMNIKHERYEVGGRTKWLRKSLRTRNLDDAKRKGRELWLETVGRIQSSQPIFAPTTAELVNRFLEVKKAEVGINKTMGRYSTIRTQLGWYLEFVGSDIKITDVDRNIWDDYYRFRKTHRPEVTDMTLTNEKSTIRSMYRWAIRLEYLPQRFLPEFPPISTESVKRRALTVEEWRTIYEHMRSKEWTNQRR